jgi:hypothetical protein
VIHLARRHRQRKSAAEDLRRSAFRGEAGEELRIEREGVPPQGNEGKGYLGIGDGAEHARRRPGGDLLLRVRVEEEDLMPPPEKLEARAEARQSPAENEDLRVALGRRKCGMGWSIHGINISGGRPVLPAL